MFLHELPPRIARALPTDPQLQRPVQGETSDVTIVRGGGPPVVVKRSRGAVYASWAQREATVLEALADADLPTPSLLAVETTTDETGATNHWMVTSCLEGRAVWDLLVDSVAEDRRVLLTDLGTTLAKIHATAVPQAFDEEPGTPWLDRHRMSLELLRDPSETFFAELEAPTAVRCLIHGDFTLDNVLAQEGRITGVIDWGGAARGDPRFDIALALATEPEFVLDAADISAFFEGYAKGPLSAPLRGLLQAAYGRC